MHTITTPTGVTIDVYDDIHETPARVYAAFQRAWVEYSGIGSDMRSSEGHRARLALFMEGQQWESAVTEFNNYLIGLAQMEVGAHLGAELLATVVCRIGGEAVAAPADRNYEALADRLLDTGITEAQVQEAVQHVRGKWARR